MITTHFGNSYPSERIYFNKEEISKSLDGELTSSNDSFYSLVIASWFVALYILASLFGAIEY